MALLSSVALAASSATWTILSVNVAGLPTILDSTTFQAIKPTTRTQSGPTSPNTGTTFPKDFDYHAYIYATDDHTYRTATSGGVPFGSGLNTLAKYTWGETTFARVKWSDCYLNSSDCLTPKGFTYVRMTIATPFTTDVYNLHTDAGDEAGDISARASSLQQVAEYISTNSVGQAVLCLRRHE